MRIYFWFGIIILISLFTISCANVGSPSGGPKDVDPPFAVKSNPLPNKLGFKEKNITIEFNENILLDKPLDRVYLSPPMKTAPLVKAYGKKLYVELSSDEDYLPNTTYTLDFGSSIVDNNEKNPLEEFSFAWSTDSVLDTLRISGYVVFADNLDPAENIYVEIYKNQDDSTFRKNMPLRIGKTNEEGYFCIRNVSPGTYNIVALKDQNRNYMFDQKSELIGFSREDITPSIDKVMLPDTIWRDSVTVDSIFEKLTDVYGPYDLLLQIFQEVDSNFYFDKIERKTRERIDIMYSGHLNKLPELEPLNFNPNSGWYIFESSPNLDTLQYWITDSTIYNNDTLKFALHHWKADSNQVMQPTIDTLLLSYKEIKTRKQKKGEEITTPVLKLGTNASGAFSIIDTINLISPSPILKINPSSICMQKQLDSTVQDMPIVLNKKDERTYQIFVDLKYGESYTFKLDSAAVFDIYGLTNVDLESSFKVRKLETYGSLKVDLSNSPKNLRVQLMNTSDAVIKELAPKGNSVEFTFVEPGDYYLRAYIDLNENSLWDTGNYKLKKQAEQIIYHEKKITLKANWDLTESWDLQEFSLLEQKNKDLKGKVKRDED